MEGKESFPNDRNKKKICIFKKKCIFAITIINKQKSRNNIHQPKIQIINHNTNAMKKTLYICFMLLATFSTTTQAQSYYYNINISNTTNGIVREQNIAYYEENGIGHFAYIIPVMNAPSQAKVPAGWHIRDFHVLNDTVYFCGIDSTTSTALLGHFSKSDLTTNCGSMAFHYDNTIGSYLSILNRIAVAIDKTSGKVSLMAIGHSVRGVDPDISGADCAVYYHGYPFHISGEIYLSTINDTAEVFWDVTPTDKYLALVGSCEFLTKWLTLHRVPIGTPLPSFLPSINQLGSFCYSDTFACGIRSAAMTYDTIALSLYYKTASGPKLQLFVIDVPSITMKFNQRYLGVTNTTLTDVLPCEITFIRDSNVIMVLEPYHIRPTLIHKLYPWATATYYESPYYMSNNDTLRFTSLCAQNANTFHAIAGDSLMICPLNALPAPGQTATCILSYTNDIFTFLPKGRNLIESGTTKECKSKFSTLYNGTEPSSVVDCTGNPFY